MPVGMCGAFAVAEFGLAVVEEVSVGAVPRVRLEGKGIVLVGGAFVMAMDLGWDTDFS